MKMVDVMQEMRERVEAGEDAESVRRDMIVRGYTSEEIEKAAKAFDWRAEKRELEESGKQDNYDDILRVEANRQLKSKMSIIGVCTILLIVFFLVFGLGPIFLLGATGVVVVMMLGLGDIGKRGIH